MAAPRLLPGASAAAEPGAGFADLPFTNTFGVFSLASGNPIKYTGILNNQEACCYNLQGINEQSGTYGNK